MDLSGLEHLHELTLRIYDLLLRLLFYLIDLGNDFHMECTGPISEQT